MSSNTPALPANRWLPLVAASLLALAAPPPAAGQTLATFGPSIPGSSTVVGHEGWIGVDSLQWGVGVGLGPVQPGGVRETSPPSLSDVVWSQGLDASVPALASRLLAGTADGSATFEVLRRGEAIAAPFLRLQQQHPALTSLSLGLGNSGSQVSLSQTAPQLSLAYLGDATGEVQTSYDLLTRTTTGATSRASTGLLANAPAEAGTYLRLGGNGGVIAGDSRAAGYENWIRVDSLQFGMAVPVALGSGASGIEIGQPSFSEISFSQAFDATTPVVLANLLQGRVVGQAIFETVSLTGGNPVTTSQLVLDNAVFSGLSLAVQDDSAQVSLSMGFSAFMHTAYTFKPDGTRDAAYSAGFDLATGSPTTDPVRLASLAGFGAGTLVPTIGAPIPEPQTWALLAAGLALLATRRRPA